MRRVLAIVGILAFALLAAKTAWWLGVFALALGVLVVLDTRDDLARRRR